MKIYRGTKWTQSWWLNNGNAWIEYFRPQLEGKKNFEIRKNDRNYQVGDTLVLKEYDPKTNKFTGINMLAEVTYITDYMQKDGYVVLGTKRFKLRIVANQNVGKNQRKKTRSNHEVIDSWRRVIRGATDEKKR